MKLIIWMVSTMLLTGCSLHHHEVKMTADHAVGKEKTQSAQQSSEQQPATQCQGKHRSITYTVKGKKIYHNL